MQLFDAVVLVVGFALLLLALISGHALFKNALRIPTSINQSPDGTTLWCLFLLGLTAGLFLVWLGMPAIKI